MVEHRCRPAGGLDHAGRHARRALHPLVLVRLDLLGEVVLPGRDAGQADRDVGHGEEPDLVEVGHAAAAIAVRRLRPRARRADLGNRRRTCRHRRSDRNPQHNFVAFGPRNHRRFFGNGGFHADSCFFSGVQFAGIQQPRQAVLRRRGLLVAVQQAIGTPRLLAENDSSRRGEQRDAQRRQRWVIAIQYFHAPVARVPFVEAQAQPLAVAGAPEPSYGAITPETYLGYLRLDRYAGSPLRPDDEAAYRFKPAQLPPDHLAYAGRWRVEQERAVAVRNARLRLRFRARDVHLVMTGRGQVDVLVDGKRVRTVRVEGDRLYTLLSGEAERDGLLELRFAPGVAGYAFTFG